MPLHTPRLSRAGFFPDTLYHVRPVLLIRTWPGRRAQVLLSLGLAPHIVAQLGRWLSIESMKAYLTLDVNSLINFSNLRPSRCKKTRFMKGLAFQFTYSRFFSGERGASSIGMSL